MISTLWHSRKDKTTETVKDQYLPGIVGEGGTAGGAQRVQGSETTLCVPVVVGPCHHTFVQTHSLGAARSDPGVPCEL